MIAVGTPMPNLGLLDSSGEPIRLLDAGGERGLLVFFMRSSTCPICNAHVRDLVRQAESLASRGVGVVVAVPEGVGAAAELKERRGASFPVVTGGATTAHESIGLAKRVFGSVQQSGTVLVDGSGIVRYAQSSTLPTGSYDRRAIAAALDELVPADRV